MTEEWKLITDKSVLREDFDAASTQPLPVSRQELDKMKSEREHPSAPVLKPEGPAPGLGNSPIHGLQEQQRSRNRESRIQYIEERLGRLKDRAVDAFEKANVVPPPNVVSKQEVLRHGEDIRQLEDRVQYVQERLKTKKDKARHAFDKVR